MMRGKLRIKIYENESNIRNESGCVCFGSDFYAYHLYYIILSRYMFRVKSENVYGMSEPGDESDPFDVASATTER
jgi:hypothetical protein